MKATVFQGVFRLIPARLRRLAVGLPALLALTAYLALSAPSPSSAVPAEFVGIHSVQSPSASELGRVGKARVRVLRIQLNWRSIEPKRPTRCSETRCVSHTYRWGRYDQLFDRAARRGIRLVPLLLGSPSWAAPDVRWVPTYGKPGYAAWKRQSFYHFAKAAAKRYGSEGTFWMNKSYATSAVRARFWQVWNEPNLPNYWWNQQNGRRSALEYAQLLKGTSAALTAGDSGARTVSAGLPWSSHATRNPPAFLQRMFSKSGTASATDFVAIHPYARTPGGVVDGVRQVRRALNGTSARSRPLWLTEFGWAHSGPSSTFTTSPRLQAKYLRDTYRWLLRNRRFYAIRGAIWFTLIDDRRSPDAWYYNSGLFRSNRRTPYQSWWALNCVTRGGSNFCRYGR